MEASKSYSRAAKTPGGGAKGTKTRFIRGVGVLGAVLALSVATIGAGGASSHREAPLTASDPQIDATDLYAFVSPDAADTVTLISNWIPFQEPAGGPNFYPFGDGVRYNIHIDNNGDAKPDITYRWTFNTNTKNKDTFLYNTGPVNTLQDETLNVAQTYKLEQVRAGGRTETLLDNAPTAPSYVGKASMPDYAKLRNEAVVPLTAGNGKSFAGQADDPFFLDLRIFDLLYGGNLSEVGNETLKGYNVNTIALQVPKAEVASGGDPVVGVWTTAERRSTKVLNGDGSVKTSGDYVQVSRLGNPLVNEAVVPLQFKDAFNASKPEGDKQFLPKVQDPEVPKLIEKIYNMKAPATPRDDLVSVFLTGVDGLNKPANVTPSEQLRLNTSMAPASNPNRLGVIGGDKAGFPNGRRLGDDVVDIALQVLEGELVDSPNDLGDGVDANDVRFGAVFPYVALPHSGSEGGSAAGSGSGGSAAGSGSGGSAAGSGSESTASAETTSREGVPSGGVGAGAGGAAGGGRSGLPLNAAVVGLLGIVMLGGAWVTLRRA